jgi:hypothetical protein
VRTRTLWPVAIASLCLVLTIAGRSHAAAPLIHVEKDAWNFGEVAEGFVARGELTVENHGDAPLHILNVRATCSGCSAGAATEESDKLITHLT